MAVDRKAMKAQLESRIEESSKVKDSNGKKTYESYLDLPTENIDGEDVKFPMYSILKSATDIGKTHEHFFNIIPWQCGSKYPSVDYPDRKKGDWVYFLDLHIHDNVGPEKKRVVCPLRNYGKRCPICEHRDELLKEANNKDERREVYKAKNPKRRAIYFVRVSEDGKNNEEFKKGVQIADIPYSWSEAEFQKAATLPRGGGLIPYAMDDKSGREIMLCVKKTGEGFYSVDGHKLLERNYEITDEELDSTFALDEHVKLHPYDKISSMYWGEDEEVEEEAPEAETKEEAVDPAPEKSSEKSNVCEMGSECHDVTEEAPGCPAGGEFGIDFNSFEDCDTCIIDSECKAEKRKMTQAKKEAKPASGRKRPRMTDDSIPF